MAEHLPSNDLQYIPINDLPDFDEWPALLSARQDPIQKRAPLRICMTATIGASLVALIGVPVGFLALAAPIAGWICLAVAASLAIVAILAGFCHIQQQDELLRQMVNNYYGNNQTLNMLKNQLIIRENQMNATNKRVSELEEKQKSFETDIRKSRLELRIMEAESDIKDIKAEIKYWSNRIMSVAFPAQGPDQGTPWAILSIKYLIDRDQLTCRRLNEAEEELRKFREFAQSAKHMAPRFVRVIGKPLAKVESRIENLEKMLSTNSQEPGQNLTRLSITNDAGTPPVGSPKITEIPDSEDQPKDDENPAPADQS